MKVFRRFKAKHDDYIHDIAYDFYGRRLATCSSDQKVKVWDLDAQGEWSLSAEIKAHSGSVQKVAWAHPEFGSILASCSADRQVFVYEEQVDMTTNKRTWSQRANLSDSRDAVQDIKFAPRHHGLKLATCSLDGLVRVYEAVDVTNLNIWPLVEEFEADKKDCSCISWNPSPFDPPMMVVGSQGSARVWEYVENGKRWHMVADLEGHKDSVHDVAWAPHMGRSFHLIATACKDQRVRIYKLKSQPAKDRQKLEVALVAELDQHHAEVWRVEWNITGTILASTADDGTARLWRSDFHGKYQCSLIVSGSPEDEKGINSVEVLGGQAGAGNAVGNGFAPPAAYFGSAFPPNRSLDTDMKT